MQSHKQNIYNFYKNTSQFESFAETRFVNWSIGYFRCHYSVLIPNDKQSAMLEIGCGTGRYIKALSEMGYTDTSGIDISEVQIEYARTKLGLKNIEKADVFSWLKNKESEFDCILVIDVLEHFETEALLELGQMMFTALRPGGRLIVQVPNALSPFNPLPYGDITHVRSFTAQSMHQFFLYQGFVLDTYFEIQPYVHNLKSCILKLLWKFLFKPCIACIVWLMHGKIFGGSIFTANFIAVAQKP